MKAAIIYYSGTGNTFRVGELFKNLLKQNKTSVTYHNISKSQEIIKGYDLIVIGTPTYSKVASERMTNYLDEYVSKSNNLNAKVITFITHSWDEAYGHITLKEQMKAKKFDVLSSVAYQMPNNHYMMMGEKGSDSEIKALFQSAVKKTTEVVNAYFDNRGIEDTRSDEIRKENENQYKMLQTSWVPVYAQNYLKVDDAKCVNCGLCIKECPNNNISFNDGKIEFENKCLACAKCFNSCPVNAYVVTGKSVDQYTLNNKSIQENLEG